MARLAEVLKQEYKTRGLVGGTATAVGKRSLEMLDVRNVLFGGSGLGSVIGQKIFGQGYSATRKGGGGATSPSAISQELTGASTGLLQDISINTQITAKNSSALPKMAFDMNIMRQNIAKLVKAQGISPARRGDMYFQSAKERERIYEEQFKRSKPTSPVVVQEKKKEGFSLFGLLGSAISTLGSVISTAISTAISALGTVLSIAINALATALIGRKIIGAIPGRGGAAAGGKGGKTRGGRGGRFGGLLGLLGLGMLGAQFYGDEPEVNSSEIGPSPDGGPTSTAEGGKTDWGNVAMSGAQATVGVLSAASVVSGVAARSPVQGYNAKAKQFTDAGGKFVSGKNLPKGDMLKKFLDFAAKASKKGWMGRIASKLALKLGTSIALKAMTFLGGLAVPGVGWFASAVSMALLAVDAYLIYDAIFGPGGILEELEKEDASQAPSQQNGSTTPAPGPTSTSPEKSSGGSGAAASSSTPTPAGSMDLTGKKFKDLSREEQDALLDRQFAMEGNKPGNLAYDLNNPGAMLYADWQKKYGAKPNYERGVVYKDGKKVPFAQFPDFQSGREAQRALWVSKYGDLSPSAAIARWSGTKEGSAEHQRYLAGTFGPGTASSATAVAAAPSGKGSKIDVASREREAGKGGAEQVVLNDIKLMAEGLRAPAMGPLSLVEKAMPYDRDFYQGVTRTVAL